MQIRPSKLILPAALAAAIPAATVFAQTQGQTEPRAAREARPSAETMARLQDGRIAMIKEALKLNDAQLKLWTPVEQQMRASFAARQQARAERRAWREQSTTAERSSLSDRLDRVSKRMTDRADRMKSYADAFRPFYASLTDDQKAVAGVVLRQGMGMGRSGHRWGMHREFRERRAEER